MEMPQFRQPPPHELGAPMHANGGPQYGQTFPTDGKFYSLKVEQQPDRARMCGFGDKDRRPITPPPCIRLIITDAATGREVNYEEVEGNFVLSVDIFDADGEQPANEVKHSSSSASVSISMATVTSYPPPPEAPPQHHFVQHVPGMPGPYGHPQQYLPPLQGAPPQQVPAQGPPPGYPPPQPGQQQRPPQMPHQPWSQPQPMYGQPQHPVGGLAPPIANGQFQRNLIGSSHVSAVQLYDLEDNLGYWFVLQDLSVRTEGTFRLKLSFVDVRLPNGQLNSEKVTVLATVFTEPFQVYSAKKFPGVKESTELSRCFAGQGVKIPIRKDTGGSGGAGSRGGRRDDDDDD